jgi:hypothetical protein
MKSFLKDLFQASIAAALIGFPFAIYFYQMKP